MKVQLQLRRPSDGAVSEPRPFDFLPLDSGRGFWTAKRLKTNYNVFNNILATDSRMMVATNSSPDQQHQLKRKSRVMQPQATAGEATDEAGIGGISVAVAGAANLSGTAAGVTVASPSAVMSSPTLVRQQLPNGTGATNSVMVSSYPPPPPPVRNFNTMSLTPHSNNPLLARPHSSVSDCSIASSTATDATGKHSVNEILSLAGGEEKEDISVYSVDLNEALASPDGALSFNSLMKMGNPGEPSQNNSSVEEVKKTVPARKDPVMGSVTSVATIKENKKSATITHDLGESMDVDALYDDVMQCVYDDVDTKYDLIDHVDENPPPLPPARTSTRTDDVPHEAPELPSPEKPLPGTPSKLPTLLAKISGKSGEATLSRKKKEEKAKQEKKKKQEEKDVEPKKGKKKESGTKSDSSPQKSSSLFQRVFHRSKSQSEEAPQPPNADDPNANEDSSAGANENGFAGNNNEVEPTEADLSDLQQFIDEGNLDHLDNMVTEFAKQYMPEEPPENNNIHAS